MALREQRLDLDKKDQILMDAIVSNLTVQCTSLASATLASATTTYAAAAATCRYRRRRDGSQSWGER